MEREWCEGVMRCEGVVKECEGGVEREWGGRCEGVMRCEGVVKECQEV